MGAAIKYLGRKFLFCAGTSLLVLIGTRAAPPALFGEACAALVALALGFCYGNVQAGKYGLPGKSAQDSKDGSKTEE